MMRLDESSTRLYRDHDCCDLVLKLLRAIPQALEWRRTTEQTQNRLRGIDRFYGGELRHQLVRCPDAGKRAA
eukprot:1200630-Rhodomonas_salina.2